MKIYTKIILDKNNNLISEEFFEYSGSVAFAGIHYDYKSTRSAKLMEKQAKRKKLAERRAKKMAKEGTKKDEEKVKPLDTSKPITLDFLTNR